MASPGLLSPRLGRDAGLEFVFSAPPVRSSSNAAHVFEQMTAAQPTAPRGNPLND
ncbi:hypothetical protein DSECCO2_563660 [anaerobic digester metagenome]